MKIPKTAYVLLWFPKPSETFIFSEVEHLLALGMPLQVFTLYGRLRKALSAGMQAFPERVERLGVPYLGSVHREAAYWWKRDRSLVTRLVAAMLRRRWRGPEKSGENLWAFLCAFRLARRFLEEGIEHIHAPWADGPATAAWAASHLTGIPFSFTARANDIFPHDALLGDKIRDAAFLRSETAYNFTHLARFTGGDRSKMYLTYNGVPLRARGEAPVRMQPPYRLLALGRFIGKKGYEYLLEACRMLQYSGLDFHLTIAGDGPRRGRLLRLCHKLGLAHQVAFPGYVPHHRVSELFRRADMFLMPSVVDGSGDRDGIPLVLMEALVHRVPVIATRLSGIPELIEDGVTGLLIPSKDPAAIARAVRRLAADREQAVAMAERGRNKVLDRFDPDKNYRKVLELYQRLLAADRPPAAAAQAVRREAATPPA